MARSWLPALFVSLAALAALDLLACANPTSTSGTSGELDPPDGSEGGAEVTSGDGRGQAQGEFGAVAPVPVAAPAPDSCRATKIRDVRYGSTVDQSVKLPDKLGAERCYEDPYTKLETDIACARDFNVAARGHALYEQGLAEIAMEPVQVWIGDPNTNVMEIGAIYPHPEQPKRSVVLVGMEGSNCSGYHSYNSVGPGVSLAENQAGEVVVVYDKPTIEARQYPSCTCFPGCGAYMEAMPVYALLPKGAKVGAPVELEYPAIVISTNSVDTQSCCCAP